MGIFENIIAGILYLAIMSLDIVILFSSIRLLVNRWPYKWLLAFDRVGEPLVKCCLTCCDQVARRLGIDTFRPQRRLVCTLLGLMTIRILLAGIWQLLVRL